MIFQAKKYESRKDLEDDIRSQKGLTTNLKDDTIEGTKVDLDKLFLKNGSMVWGIRVIQIDKKLKKKPVVNRGKIHKFEIK